MASTTTKAPAVTVTLISENFVQGYRDIELHRTVKLSSGHKLKVDIRRNEFDFQSHAHIDLWDGSKWNRVHSIPYQKMRSLVTHAGIPNQPQKPFEQDYVTLLDAAKQIIA